MRKVIDGNGNDSTAAVAAYLLAGNTFRMSTLYLIGEPEDPMAVWLTDYESPLLWSVWGTFQPAVIARGTVTSKVGLEVQSLDFSWTPKQTAFTQNINTANPYQLAQLGYYRNWKVRAWTVYMPTPGDANTYGCSELFGGRISQIAFERGQIRFTVNSFLDVVNQQVPQQTIELMNSVAGYRGATPPPGISQVPQFTCIGGSSTTAVIARCDTPTVNQIFATDVFHMGYIVFQKGGAQTLGGIMSSISSNGVVNVAGTNYNRFILYKPLPWTPTANVDLFYASATYPINSQDGNYLGFPYVPTPTSAI